MTTERIDLVLEVNGKERARASVTRCYEGVERQRYRWVHTYGLTPKKDWKIYLEVPSSMEQKKVPKITNKDFAYTIKKQKTMSNQKSSQSLTQSNVISQLILNGDLSKLTATDKVKYYNGYCERMGLDPFTKPFDILRLNGREVLYCTRSGTQQLNKLHQVSHLITSRELIEAVGVYQVTSKASLPDGRCTESIGAVNIAGLKGEAYANAIMKAETKAKRRATLDLLGLGVLDESETESIPNAEPVSLLVAEPQEEIKEEVNLECSSLGTLMVALSRSENLEEIKALYFANKSKVDTNGFIKEAFTNRKNELNGNK